MDQHDRRLNLDVLEFRPRTLSSEQIDTKEGLELTKFPSSVSVDPLALSREGVTDTTYNSRHINHLEGYKERLFLQGCMKGKKVNFPIDMGTDITLTSLTFLGPCPSPCVSFSRTGPLRYILQMERL